MYKSVSTLFFAGALLLTAWQGAQASQANTNPFMQTVKTTRPPTGYVQFCGLYPNECKTKRLKVQIVKLTEARWRELLAINAHVNYTIAPVTDAKLYKRIEYWTYPNNGSGDCEDYVLLKKRMLMKRGWPASALLITVARDSKGGGHAVLTVRTDRGDLILDNFVSEVLLWNKTNYRYLKRQSERNNNSWVSIADRRRIQLSQAR